MAISQTPPPTSATLVTKDVGSARALHLNNALNVELPTTQVL